MSYLGAIPVVGLAPQYDLQVSSVQNQVYEDPSVRGDPVVYDDPVIGAQHFEEPEAGYGLPSGGIVGGAYADLPSGDAGFTQPGMPGEDDYGQPVAPSDSKIGTYLMIAGAAILVLFLTKK
uniref:Uncharacterized protein n=1 Tax=viral metagenome TaxID=1070528 RepID=A0A6M3XNW0_9ZZZZ